MNTLTIPVDVRYFDPSGWFIALQGTYLRQDVEFPAFSLISKGNDDAFLLDAAVGYRLPNRLGIFSIEGRNLLDRKFHYQDRNIQAQEPSNPTFVPDLTILARFTLTL